MEDIENKISEKLQFQGADCSTMMCTWALPFLFFMVGTGLSSGHKDSDPGAGNVGLSAILALVQHQSSSFDRLHEDLTATERKVDSLASQLLTLERKMEEEKTDRQQDKSKVDSLESQLNALDQTTEADLQAIKKKVDATSGLLHTKVGFMAKLGHDQRLGPKTVLKLDQVQYNEGNAYSPSTGMFTAPVAGMYTFFIKTEQRAKEEVTLEIMKEGQSNRVLYIHASDSGSYETASGQVLLHLARRQNVWVQTMGGGLVRRYLTRFGGFLVHPDA